MRARVERKCARPLSLCFSQRLVRSSMMAINHQTPTGEPTEEHAQSEVGWRVEALLRQGCTTEKREKDGRAWVCPASVLFPQIPHSFFEKESTPAMPPLASLKPALGRGIADVATLTSRVKAVSLAAPRPVAVAVQGKRGERRERDSGRGKAQQGPALHSVTHCGRPAMA